MRVAIVKLSAMGDIIHAMAALQFMKKYDPELEIDWVVEEVFAPLLMHNPHVNNILPVNLKGLKKDAKQIFSEIKKVKRYAKNEYDLVIDAQGLVKSAIVAKILGRSVGFDKASIRESIAAYLYNNSFAIPYEKNVIERNLSLMMQAVGANERIVDLQHKEAFLFFDEADKAKAASFVKNDVKNIVYILGSSWESKVYPAEKLIEVIGHMEGNHLLVWGSDTEKERAAYISQRTEAISMPKLTLNELKALIASSDLVIGGDSGPTHMAWALNRPSITLFGPTPAERNTLVTEINRVIDCGKKIDSHHLDRQDMCIEKIAPEKIVSLAKELLS